MTIRVEQMWNRFFVADVGEEMKNLTDLAIEIVAIDKKKEIMVLIASNFRFSLQPTFKVYVGLVKNYLSNLERLKETSAMDICWSGEHSGWALGFRCNSLRNYDGIGVSIPILETIAPLLRLREGKEVKIHKLTKVRFRVRL